MTPCRAAAAPSSLLAQGVLLLLVSALAPAAALSQGSSARPPSGLLGKYLPATNNLHPKGSKQLRKQRDACRTPYPNAREKVRPIYLGEHAPHI